MNRNQFLALLKVSFLIACIIFFTAILSEFSVRMYYSSTDWLVQIIAGLLAILLITLVIIVLLLWVRDLRGAFLRVFGIEEG